MIWDCLTWRNEWECLEIRLHELAPRVDRFVLVQANFTFQGDPREPEYDGRFDDFPLMVITLTDDQGIADPWGREAFQRNAVLQGLEGADSDDIVLLSDADEIPRGEVVVEAVKRLDRGEPQVSFEQTLSFYHVNNCSYTGPWDGTQACTVEWLRGATPDEVRRQRHGVRGLPNGGWHWCNLGDPEWLVEKIESFSHTEVNLPEYKDRDFLAQCIEGGREMTGRQDILFRVEDTDDLPRYLLENRERFAHLFADVKAAA